MTDATVPTGSNRSSSSSNRVWPSSAVSGCVDWGGFFFGGWAGAVAGAPPFGVRLGAAAGVRGSRCYVVAGASLGRRQRGGGASGGRRAAPFVFATPCLQIWMAA